MTQIQAEIDAYGTYARASALADFAELWAIQDVHVTEATVDDYLRDMDWLKRDLELLTDGTDEEEEEVESGQEVFDVMRERKQSLGDFYPFDIIDGALKALRSSPSYSVLHAITVAHAFELFGAGVVEGHFESLVVRVLEARGLRVAHLGALRKTHGSFELALTHARPLTGLLIPGVGDRSSHAHDEGVDAVAHLDWDDSRSVNWTFIGQATCAKSDEWEVKINQPAPMKFKDFLGTIVHPLPFLVVPHHVPTRRLQYLAGLDGRMILDRLRLARWVGTPTADEKIIVQAVEQATINLPY